MCIFLSQACMCDSLCLCSILFSVKFVCFNCLQLFWFGFDLGHCLIFLASNRFSGAWIRSWHNASTSPLSTGWSVTANTHVPWTSTMTSISQSLSLSGQRPKRSYRRKRTSQRLCSLWGRWLISCEETWCQWAIFHFLTASASFWPCLRPDLMIHCIVDRRQMVTGRCQALLPLTVLYSNFLAANDILF